MYDNRNSSVAAVPTCSLEPPLIACQQILEWTASGHTRFLFLPLKILDKQVINRRTFPK